MENLSNTDLLSMLVGEELAASLAEKPLVEVFGFQKSDYSKLNERQADYSAHPAISAAKELMTRCLKERMRNEAVAFTSPEIVKSFLCSKIGHLEHESFWCLWLDTQNRLIDAHEMFRGTIAQTSVHPREIVKTALTVNAAAVIFAHNHPSGFVEPSRSDVALTDALKSSLGLVDIRVLDHFVIARNDSLSFAEKGLL